MTNEAMQKYNKLMSIHEVQRAYKLATGTRKDNRRNCRLQDAALVLAGHPVDGSVSPLSEKSMTKKEAEFISVYKARLEATK